MDRNKPATLASIITSEKYPDYKAFCSYWSRSIDNSRKSVGFVINGKPAFEYWIDRKHRPTWGELIDHLDQYLSKVVTKEEVSNQYLDLLDL